MLQHATKASPPGSPTGSNLRASKLLTVELGNGRPISTVPRASQSFSASSLAPSSRWMPPVNTLGMGQLVRAIANTTLPGCPRPSSTWLQSYSEATKNRLHHLRPRQLATVIRSIVALEYHPGEEWLGDFDTTCFSHPGPFDTLSAVKVLASMAALPDINYTFPQSVYLKLMSEPHRFDNYQELACLLHCLGGHNVPFWDESRFLTVVGVRMGQLLSTLPEDEASSVVTLTLSKPKTIAAVLEM